MLKRSIYIPEMLRSALHQSAQTARRTRVPRSGLSFRTFFLKTNPDKADLVNKLLRTIGLDANTKRLRYRGILPISNITPSFKNPSSYTSALKKAPVLNPEFSWRVTALNPEERMASVHDDIKQGIRSVRLNDRTKLFTGAPGYDTALNELPFKSGPVAHIFIDGRYLQRDNKGKVLTDWDQFIDDYEILKRLGYTKRLADTAGFVYPYRTHRLLSSKLPRYRQSLNYGKQAVRQAEGRIDDIGAVLLQPGDSDTGLLFTTSSTKKPFKDTIRQRILQQTYKDINDNKRDIRSAVSVFGHNAVRVNGKYDDNATIKKLLSYDSSGVKYDTAKNILYIAPYSGTNKTIPLTLKDRNILAQNGAGVKSRLGNWLDTEDYW